MYMYKFNFVHFLLNNASNWPTLKNPLEFLFIRRCRLLHTFADSYFFSEAFNYRNMLFFTNVNVQADDKGVTIRVNLK